MITYKHTPKIINALMAVAVIICFVLMVFASDISEALGDTGISMEYEEVLFDTSRVLDINIIMNEDDWNEMLENAISEEYYTCNVEIAGEMFYNVAIRPKGNTSLSSIASDPDSDRFSFKLEFDHYTESQTCFGLDKLILNNNYADATNMKEALIYDMYNYIGADASLYNYSNIYVNGQYWGIYLALEAVEDSFMLRNYGVTNGELYKPESMNMGGGGGMNRNMSSDSKTISNTLKNMSESNPSFKDFDISQIPDMENFGGGGGFNMGGFSMGGGGANLNYIDDNLDSYSTIWDGEVTSSDKGDHKRVITALKNISEGNDLETYMDTDNLLKYMAVHLFSVNDDSLSGSMAHNYYLYEHNGMLNIIPWDYNLAFGGMGMGNNDATEVVNSPIDNAFSSTNFFDTLMEDEYYHEKYYEYMSSLVNEYIDGGAFDAFYQRTREQIDELVKADPNALYTYDEYITAVEMLYEVVNLRGESIQRQLDGEISTTKAGRSSEDNLVDASHIDLGAMGSMSMGGGMNRIDKNRTDENNNKENISNVTSQITSLSASSEGFLPQNTPSGMPEGFDPSQFGGGFSGEGPEDFDPSQFGNGFSGGFNSETPDTSGQEGENSQGGESGSSSDIPSRGDMGNMPNMNFGNSSQTNNTAGIIYITSSSVLLIIALYAATKYKRKPRRR